jgi:tetratricopeptide (TPR) repeat protein
LTGVADEALVARGIAALERAIAHDAGSPSAWRALGYLRLARGEEDATLAAWRRAAGMTGELLAKGAAAEADARYDEALAWYRRATAIDPASVDAWLQTGATLELQGDWMTAAAAYSTGASATPDNSDLLFRIAQVQRQYASAIDWPAILDLLDRAIAQDNFLYEWDRTQSHHLRGEALRTVGRAAEALAEFTWVTQHRPNDFWATLSHADLTWEVERDAVAAEQLFREAIAIDGENKWAYLLQGSFYTELGRLDEAKAAYEQVLRIDPTDQSALEWLARQ